MADRAREMLDEGMGRARNFMSGDAQFFTAQQNNDQIRKQLDSETVSHKKEGMKRIVAQMCIGNDMSMLFPDVVKNIHVASIELRKLIYYFIVHYSEERQNEALLSISAFQHDLLDQSMHVRALALRTLSSIRIPAVHPVVMVAIKKASTDLAPLVRRTAATAVAKAHRVAGNDAMIEQMIPILTQLLGDKSMDVVGAAAATFTKIAPDRFDLIHKHFRRICRALVECDEWGQIAILQMMLRYARANFVNPDKPQPKKPKARRDDDDSDDEESESSEDEFDRLGATLSIDNDHRLLVQSVKPLFHSINRAVVLAAASLYFHIAPQQELDLCAKPLLRLLADHSSGHHIALVTIAAFLTVRSKPFVPYVRDFYLTPHDSRASRQLRLRIMAKLVTRDNQLATLNEQKSYLRSYDTTKVVDAIHGMGLVAFTLPDATGVIIKHILPMLAHKSADVVTEAVVTLRQLVVQTGDKVQKYQIVQKLASRVLKNEIKSPAARASTVWLVGENIKTHPNIAKMAPDFFRHFVKSFKTEEPIVKSNVLTLGCKIWLNLAGEGEMAARFKAMFLYLLELAKYDDDYDLRDHGRLIETTLDRQSACFAAFKAAALAPKPAAETADQAARKFQLGSLSHALGAATAGYEEVPEWPEEMPEPDAREPPQAASEESSVYSTSGSDSSDGSDSDSDASDSDATTETSDSASDSATASDSDDAPPKPVAPRPAAPKVKVVTKILSKPKSAPGRDRVVDELFTAPKPAPKGAKHADPAALDFVGLAKMHGVSVAAAVPAAPVDGAYAVQVRFTNGTDTEVHIEQVDDSDAEDDTPSIPAVKKLAAGAERIVTVSVPAGRYSQLRLAVDATTDSDAEDDDRKVVPFTITLPTE